MNQRPRVLLFGGNGGFSQAVLRRLHAAEIAVDAVICFGFEGASQPPGTPFRVKPPPRAATTASLAQELGLRHQWVDDLRACATRQRLRELTADFVLSVCFPRRLPAWVQHLPSTACLNLHPSLLPAYRGPAPLFWQFRNGERRLGVTLHKVTDELDAGPVLAQLDVQLRDGLRHAEICEQLAGVGADLFAETLSRRASCGLRYVEQDAQAATYQPVPRAEDFTLDRRWSARRAFNFMRATEHYGVSYPLPHGEQTLLLKSAAAFVEDEIAPSHQRHENVVRIPFRAGTLYAQPQP